MQVYLFDRQNILYTCVYVQFTAIVCTWIMPLELALTTNAVIIWNEESFIAALKLLPANYSTSFQI